MTVVGPPEARPADGLAIDFVVESDRTQLSEIVQRVRDGRLRTNIGNVATLDDAVAALNPTERRNGKTISAFAHKDSETADTPVTTNAGVCRLLSECKEDVESANAERGHGVRKHSSGLGTESVRATPPGHARARVSRAFPPARQ